MTMKMRNFNADVNLKDTVSKVKRFQLDSGEAKVLMAFGSFVIVSWIVISLFLNSGDKPTVANNVANSVSPVVETGSNPYVLLKGTGRNFETFRIDVQPLDANAKVQDIFAEFAGQIAAGINPQDAGVSNELMYESPEGNTCPEVPNADGTVTRCGVRWGYPMPATRVETQSVMTIPDHCTRWSLANYYYGNCPNLK